MKEKIQDKLKTILVTIILCTTSVIIIQNNTTNVTASEPEEDSSYILSTDLIHRVTENLSNIIYTAYDEDELPKGRAFGTKGERYAADYLVSLLTNI